MAGTHVPVVMERRRGLSWMHVREFSLNKVSSGRGLKYKKEISMGRGDGEC